MVYVGNKVVKIFLFGAVKKQFTLSRVRTTMSSNHLNWPYDSPRGLRLGGRLFQTSGHAVAKVLSLKLLRVRLTTILILILILIQY